MLTYVPILILLALLILGVPVAWSLLLAGFVGLLYLSGFQSTEAILQIVLYGESMSYTFTTIPMFVLMAIVLGNSGITGDIFDAINHWTHRIPGGLAISTTIANGGFAALSGSSTAAAASLAKISVPEMQRHDYDDSLAIGTVAASGTFAMMFPPSIALIIYGIIVEESIASLFMAGILPGILTVLSYIALIVLWVTYRPSVAPTATIVSSWRKKFELLLPLWPAMILVLLVLGGIYGGVVTPTEAGGLGAAGAIVISWLFYDLGVEDLVDASKETLQITAMIFMIILGALLFTRYLAITGVTRNLVGLIGALPINRWYVLVLILLVYVVLGMFMNQTSVLVLTLPVTFPLVVLGLGFDPIWFGILVIKAAEIGMITPPLGLNVYVATSVVNIDVNTAFKGALKFLVADLFILALIMAFPQLALWIPSAMGG